MRLAIHASGPLYFQALDRSGRQIRIANVNTSGLVMIQYDYVKNAPPFDTQEARVELNRKLNQIPGIQILDRYAVDATWPSIHRDALSSEVTLRQFFDVLEWVTARLADDPPS